MFQVQHNIYFVIVCMEAGKGFVRFLFFSIPAQNTELRELTIQSLGAVGKCCIGPATMHPYW